MSCLRLWAGFASGPSGAIDLAMRVGCTVVHLPQVKPVGSIRWFGSYQYQPLMNIPERRYPSLSAADVQSSTVSYVMTLMA